MLSVLRRHASERAHMLGIVFLRIRCEVRSKCTSRKGLFYLKTGCANKLTRMEASVPAQGARPRGALLPEPNHAKPKGQQMGPCEQDAVGHMGCQALPA